MQMPYFQRYQKKEDVDTSNTMLMLSHLYSYDTSKFYTILNTIALKSDELPELTINIHTKGKNTIPDAFISQIGFEIAIETKLNNNFDLNQLKGHLDSLDGFKEIKILLTIDPNPMDKTLYNQFEEYLKEYNSKRNLSIKHINITFSDLINAIENVIDEHDNKIYQIFEDFKNYCLEENLISDKEYWLRAVTSGNTYFDNMSLNLYYDLAPRYRNDRGYIGLYKDKEVKAIGKIKKIVTVVYQNQKLSSKTIYGEEINKEEERRIKKAIELSKNYNYELIGKELNFFLVDKFIETHFKKASKNPLYKCKLFNLKKMLDLKEPQEASQIAVLLDNRIWEEF